MVSILFLRWNFAINKFLEIEPFSLKKTEKKKSSYDINESIKISDIFTYNDPKKRRPKTARYTNG